MPAYSRSGGGIVIRPCRSGTSSAAPASSMRPKSRTFFEVVGTLCIRAAISVKTSTG